MIKLIKRFFVYIGNCCPPPLNFFFYKIAGIKLGPGKIWIGNKCNFDTQFPENITILIGPEGGLKDVERKYLNEIKGAIACSLGPRVYRAETAALVALVMAQVK